MGNDVPHTRGWRRALAAVTVMVAAGALFGGLAAPADAASEATFTGLVPGASATIRGTAGGAERTYTAGLMAMTIDGSTGAAGYCIDIHTTIDDGASGLAEVDWASSGVPQLEVVEMILGSYHPSGSGPAGYEIVGTEAQRAAATQAAIWHHTDGFELSAAGNDPTIVANYDAILRAVADGVLPGFGEPSVSLAIAPPAETEATQGDPVGPFVISTTATAVELSPSAGVSVTDAAGTPLAGPFADGDEFWLVSDEPGTATVTATADATVHAGRVFHRDGVQRLILATTVRTTVGAEATASWTERPPETTTTTVPETTTTTTPETTTTTEPETTTTEPPATSTTEVTPQTSVPTTAPPSEAPTTEVTIESLEDAAPAPTPQPAPTGRLAWTGSNTGTLVASAIVLIATGALAGLVARRRAGRG